MIHSSFIPYFFFAFFMVLGTVNSLTENNKAVRDTNFKKLRAGEKYFILPIGRRFGGGITLKSEKYNGKYPSAVVQERDEGSNGIPVTFIPVNAKKSIVSLLTDMNIRFSSLDSQSKNGSVDGSSLVWKLSDYNLTVKQNFVTTGGMEGNPGADTVASWFKVERYQNYYNFMFCPTVCQFCQVECKNIGIYADGDGARRLALSDTPFVVMFQRVE